MMPTRPNGGCNNPSSLSYPPPSPIIFISLAPSRTPTICGYIEREWISVPWWEKNAIYDSVTTTAFSPSLKVVGQVVSQSPSWLIGYQFWYLSLCCRCLSINLHSNKHLHGFVIGGNRRAAADRMPTVSNAAWRRRNRRQQGSTLES